MAWPLNWSGALRHAAAADAILCLGSSLKVLRRYPWLWAMHRPPARRPRLFIVNLQWTPKDDRAELKINGRCDEVMRQVLERLGLAAPAYRRAADPVLAHATPLSPRELHTTSRAMLRRSDTSDSDDDRPLTHLKLRTSPHLAAQRAGQRQSAHQLHHATLLSGVDGEVKFGPHKDNSVSRLMKRLNGFNDSKTYINECKYEVNNPNKRDKHEVECVRETREETHKFNVMLENERVSIILLLKHIAGARPARAPQPPDIAFTCPIANNSLHTKHNDSCPTSLCSTKRRTSSQIEQFVFDLPILNKTTYLNTQFDSRTNIDKDSITLFNSYAIVYKNSFSSKNDDSFSDRIENSCLIAHANSSPTSKFNSCPITHYTSCPFVNQNGCNSNKLNPCSGIQLHSCPIVDHDSRLTDELNTYPNKLNSSSDTQLHSCSIVNRNFHLNDNLNPYLSKPSSCSVTQLHSCLVVDQNSRPTDELNLCSATQIHSCPTVDLNSHPTEKLNLCSATQLHTSHVVDQNSRPTEKLNQCSATQLHSCPVVDQNSRFTEKLNLCSATQLHTSHVVDQNSRPTEKLNQCSVTQIHSCPIVNCNSCLTKKHNPWPYKLNSYSAIQLHSCPTVDQNSHLTGKLNQIPNKLNIHSTTHVHSHLIAHQNSCLTEKLNQCLTKLNSCSATQLHSCATVDQNSHLTGRLNHIPNNLNVCSTTQLHPCSVGDHNLCPAKELNLNLIKLNSCTATQLNSLPTEKLNGFLSTKLNSCFATHYPIVDEDISTVSHQTARHKSLGSLRNFRMVKTTAVPVRTDDDADASGSETDAWAARVATAAVTRALEAPDVRRAYSGLHTILAPAPAPPPPPPRPRKRRRRQRASDCAFCRRHYATSRCAFYPPHDPDAREQRRVRGGALRMCDCCGHSDSECEAGGAGAGAHGPGWYGRGYGKARRRRS